MVRRTAEDTRRLILEAAIQMLLERGATAGVQAQESAAGGEMTFFVTSVGSGNGYHHSSLRCRE